MRRILPIRNEEAQQPHSAPSRATPPYSSRNTGVNSRAFVDRWRRNDSRQVALSSMGPLAVTALLFWLSVASVVAVVLLDRAYVNVIKADWKLLVGVIALVILWRLPPDGRFFHGLEYEDSYVYSVVGRA